LFFGKKEVISNTFYRETLNGKTNNALSINEAMKTIVLIKKFYEK
jgi:hypothetical protein